jgi:CHASE3 domain sensor protein
MTYLEMEMKGMSDKEKLLKYIDDYHERIQMYDEKIHELNKIIKLYHEYIDTYHNIIKNKLKENDNK